MYIVLCFSELYMILNTKDKNIYILFYIYFLITYDDFFYHEVIEVIKIDEINLFDIYYRDFGRI